MFQPYLDWIQTEHSVMIESVKKWAEINSWSNNRAGLQKICEVLHQDFECLKGHRELISFLPVQTIDKKGKNITKPIGQALSIKKRPTAPLQVFFAGHMDTVYPPDMNFLNITVEKEIIKGPGVADMKGGLVILLKTLEAFERSPYAESIGWEILINADEEIGSPGSTPFFVEAAKRNQIGLIFEPSLPDGAFVSQRKGTGNFTLSVRGQSAHSGRDFHIGRSAIYAIARLIGEFEKLNDEKKDITINVGHIEGGGPVNVVPDLAICKINIRAHQEQDLVYISTKMQEIVSESIIDGIESSLKQDSIRMPKPFDRKTAHLFNLYESCANELSIPFHIKKSGGACDGNILSSAGLATLDSLGVIGGKIHTEEEYMLSNSLVERAQLTTLFLLKIATEQISLHAELT